jgi:hypothetical protein
MASAFSAANAVYRGMTLVAQPLMQLSKAAEELGYQVEGRMSNIYATVFTRNIKKKWYYLYIYDHKKENKYLGYLDLLDFIDFGDLDSEAILKRGFEIDYLVCSTFSDSQAIMVSALDSFYLISLSRVSNTWLTLR